MSRSNKVSIFKRSLKVLALGTGGVLGLIYIQAFSKIDPFSKLRPGGVKAEDELGIRLGDVHFVEFDGAKKIAEADVDHVFITRDRQQYRMGGVRNGVYTTDSGRQLKFTAPKALWNSTYRLLAANDGVRVWNTDLDLSTQTIRIDGRKQTMYAPGQIKGLFYKGRLQTTNLLYSIKDGSAQYGPSQWNGNLALNLQDDGDKPAAKQWSFKNSGGNTTTDVSTKGDVHTMSNVEATDGEIIIVADKIVYDKKIDLVTATGNVKYFSPKANMSCEKVVAYRKEKRAILTGNVNMLVKPKDKQTKAAVVEIPPFRPVVPDKIAAGRPDAPPVKDKQGGGPDEELQDPKTIRSYPITINAAQIEYWYGKGKKHAIITGSPQARQELPGGRWRYLWAFQGFYDGEAETLRMASHPGAQETHYKASNGDDTVAEEVTVSTKEDVDDFQAKNTKGLIYGKSDDDEDVGPKPPDPIKPGGDKGKGKGKAGGGNGTLHGPIGG